MAILPLWHDLALDEPAQKFGDIHQTHHGRLARDAGGATKRAKIMGTPRER
jgi:hypothetical protein